MLTTTVLAFLVVVALITIVAFILRRLTGARSAPAHVLAPSRPRGASLLLALATAAPVYGLYVFFSHQLAPTVVAVAVVAAVAVLWLKVLPSRW